MICFDEKIVSVIENCISAAPQSVESIRLCSFGFEIQFVDFEIFCEERVFALLNGERYEWSDAPSAAPWGLFGRQLLAKSELKSSTILRLIFESTDYLEIETVEHDLESVIFRFPPLNDGSIVMDIY